MLSEQHSADEQEVRKATFRIEELENEVAALTEKLDTVMAAHSKEIVTAKENAVAGFKRNMVDKETYNVLALQLESVKRDLALA